MTASPISRAVAEYRSAHPEDDDLSDGAVRGLFVVQSRALGIAVQELGASFVEAATELQKVLRRKIASR